MKAVSSEASFAVARAAVSPAFQQRACAHGITYNMPLLHCKNLAALQELLLEELARRANVQMQSQHRSTLQYKDVGKP